MSHGPSLIFDKSTLQSLNPDEAMWLDHFFLCNITPMFFVEVLADLEKEPKGGRTPEQVVGNLAYKTPDMNSSPNVHHLTLLNGELSGAGEVDTRFGRPILAQGMPVVLGDQTGIVFKQAPEEEALMRWQYGQFREFERLTAKLWRSVLGGVNFDTVYEQFQPIVAAGSRPRTLLDVKARADSLIQNMPSIQLVRFGLKVLGYPPQVIPAVLGRWEKRGRPSVQDFLPYFAHVLSVDLFFYIGLAADLIGRERASNKADIAYLYYLPFCTVFTSNDKLHEHAVPLFLKPHQTFVPGATLKADLAHLDAHYSALPEDVKQQGVYHMAADPPDDQGFLVTRLWDKYLPHWRELGASRKKPEDLKMTDEIRALIDECKKAKPSPGNPVSMEEAAYVTMERRVRITQGKWRRFPPGVKPDSGEEE
jgi:hypothetical protein